AVRDELPLRPAAGRRADASRGGRVHAERHRGAPRGRQPCAAAGLRCLPIDDRALGRPVRVGAARRQPLERHRPRAYRAVKSRSAPLGLGMLLALALVGAPIGCRAVPRAEPTAPSTFGQLVGATLALGDFDLACERLEQARRQYPLDAGLRRWSAVVDALRWHGDEACRTLV